MHDSLVMRRSQDIRDRLRNREHTIYGKTGFANQTIQGLPFHELHCKKVNAFGLFDGEDGDDVGMIQRSNRARLSLKRIRLAGTSAIAAGRTFNATSRSSFVSTARNT
jgi:hypothetical protein